MIFAIIALLLANVSTARAEENFGFSIAGVEVSDENCDVIGKVLSWSNFLLSGDTEYMVNGDQNQDGEITAGDVTFVYNILLGVPNK